MTKNPILDELHAIREQLLAEAGGTLDALVDQLQAEEQKSVRPRFKLRRNDGANGGESSAGLPTENLLSPPTER